MADALDLDALEAIVAAAHAGPFRWYGDKKREIRLTTVDRGLIYILGARRSGMNGATFEVQSGNSGMVSLNDFAEREVPYRDDILPQIDHPDARFILAACNALPALIARCRAAEQRADNAEANAADYAVKWANAKQEAADLRRLRLSDPAQKEASDEAR